MMRLLPVPPALSFVLVLLAMLGAGACGHARSAAPGGHGPRGAVAGPDGTFVADSAAAAQRGYASGFPTFVGEDRTRIHAVVEIPAGTSEKWMVSEETGGLVWERRPGGERRVVDYLAYPANYGLIPRTAAGDGDPLDVLVLGPALPRGSVWAVRPVAVLRLTDDGAEDDKIIAVRPGEGPLGDVRGLEDLRRRRSGIPAILRTWFENYKGAAGDLRSDGYEDAAEARRTVRAAARAYEAE